MMTEQRFKEIVDAYGADENRWPEHERSEMWAYAVKSQEAQRLLTEAKMFDDLLGSADPVEPSDQLRTAVLEQAAEAFSPQAVVFEKPKQNFISALFGDVDLIDWSFKGLATPILALFFVALLGVATGANFPQEINGIEFAEPAEEDIFNTAFSSWGLDFDDAASDGNF